MLFDNTIFDDKVVANQDYSFQYVLILWALNTNTKETIDTWENFLKKVTYTE